MATGVIWRVDEYVNGAWEKHELSESKSGSAQIQLSRSARKIRFVWCGNFAGDFSNIKITQGSYLELPTNDINFGVIEQGSSISNKSININYSAINADLTASIGAGAFSIDKTNIASADCSYGTTAVNVSFLPTELGVFSDEIVFSNGSVVKVYGEYSKRINCTLSVQNVSYTSAVLGWDKVDDATAYRIVNNTTGISYIVTPDATEYNVTGLQMGTTYNFTLYAMFNGARSINGSNSVNFTTKTMDVQVVDCVVFKDNNEKKIMASTDGAIVYDIKSNNPNSLKYTKRIEFKAKMADAVFPATVGLKGDMILYVKVEGKTDYMEWGWNAEDAGITEEYKTFTADIPYNTIAVKFATGLTNGGCWRYIDDFTVLKDNVLETSVQSLDFGEVAFGESVTKEFTINTYVNASELVVRPSNDAYAVELEAIGACYEGEQLTVRVTFTPSYCAKNYTSVLTLFNGVERSITLTASLKKPTTTVSTIIWTGNASSEWDNRDNWKKVDESSLTCADILAEDLTVILPAGLTQYPTLPDLSNEKAFKDDRNEKWNGTQVNAGDNSTATKVANKIVMEYGATLMGVETLNVEGGALRYNEVEMQFAARRSEWLLVGAVVNPFEDGSTTETRQAVSGDYYLNNFPHVYMHQAVLQGSDATWDESFSDMYRPLEQNTVLAVRLPNQYGPNRLPASVYNRRNGTSYNGTAPCSYTYNGRFANETALPVYENLTPGTSVLLTNTYPANISTKKLQEGRGTVSYYDYAQGSFVPVGENTEIMSQHGFVFTPGKGVESLVLTKEDFNNTETGHRNAEVEKSYFRLRLANEAASVSSEINVSIDEEKIDEANYFTDAPKIYNSKVLALPDMYLVRYNKNWSSLAVPSLDEPIAVGVKVRVADQEIKFKLQSSNYDSDVILEDRLEGKEYNLSAGDSLVVNNLSIGNCEGRFYLKPLEREPEEEDVTTDVEDNCASKIDIYAHGSEIVVSASSEIVIERVIVSDLSGRSSVYSAGDIEFVNDKYVRINLPVDKGIYAVKVISNAAVRTEKLRLN